MTDAPAGEIDRYLSDWLCSTNEIHRSSIVTALASHHTAYTELVQRARGSLANDPAVSEKLAELAALVAMNAGGLADSASALRVQGQSL